METTDYTLPNHDNQAPERPDFLKIICILSFIASGLMILVYSLGTLALGLSAGTIEEVWPKMVEGFPEFENVDGVEFFNEVGMLSVYGLLANIFSLIGVIMMWRLEKLGFYIYAVAELLVNFFSLNVNTGEQGPQYGSLIFSIILDLVFIVMYFMNLKHMNGKKASAE